MIQSPSIRRGLAMSTLFHAVVGVLAWWALDPAGHGAGGGALVDIEVAPPPPKVEALPEERGDREAEPELAGQLPEEEEVDEAPVQGEAVIDAGVVDARPDAAIDAAPDAPIDAAPDAPIDAAPDAAVPLVAANDGGVDDAAGDDAAAIAAVLEPSDAAGGDDAGAGAGEGSSAVAVLAGEGSSAVAVLAGAGSGSGETAGSDAVAAAGSGSAAGELAPGAADEAAAGSGSAAADGIGSAGVGAGVLAITGGPPAGEISPAVDGAPTTAGTAANLLQYLPTGHTVTALIRLDRLRGTEWAEQTERLMRPMPDYRVLFGERDSELADKLETLVISTPRPSDAVATTLVGRTRLAREPLRKLLGGTTPVTWSAARGGLLGRRVNQQFRGDKRVFLSPFRGWFVLAQPTDLPGLTGAARGALDTVVATARLPAWLDGIRAIEAESGDPRGPALVVTLALDGKLTRLGDNDFGLGVKQFPMPERVSLAAELVSQGWLVRGNVRCASDAAAAELAAALTTVQQRIADSRAIQLVLGKPATRVIANLSFARAGPRLSYATSISIADMRAIMAVAATQLDAYFARQRAAPTPPP